MMMITFITIIHIHIAIWKIAWIFNKNKNKIKNLEHKGIKIELMGLIEHNEDKKNVSRFIALSKDLEPPGILSQEVTTINFNFNSLLN